MVNRPSGYGVGAAKIQLAPPPVVAQRAPATSDINYDPGQIWVDQAGDNIYILASESAGSATWVLAVAVPGEIATLTGDSGGAISPVASNIDLTGTSGEVTTAGSAGTITFGLDNPLTPPGDVAITGTLSSTGATTLATTGASVNTFGNATGATSVTITSGTGGLALVSTGSGDITASSGDTLLLDGVGVVELNSSGGVISIGNDAVNQNINLGTAGARTIAIGNTTGATGVTIDSGSGDIALNNSVNNDTNINTGTSTGAVSVGNAAAGAIALDTAAGISLDAATASNFTVTGAADLALASTTGGVNISSGEAATSDGVSILATAADGGVTIDAGSGGILAGISADCTPISVGDIAPTVSRTITVGGGTVVTASVTDTIDIGPDGATTNADSVKTVNVNTGGVTTGQVLTNVATGTVTSGTHTTAIASGNRAAGTMALNLMTGTGTKTANLGNADGLTTFNVDAITLVNDSINVDTSINTGTSTGSVNIGNSAATGVNIDGPTLVNDSINSNTSINTGTSTGTVSVGNAAAGAITVDTAAGISLDAATASNFTCSLAASAAAITISASAADGGITMDSGATPGVTFTNGTQSHQMLVGSGSPNGSVTASQGSMYVDVAGSTSTTILFVNTDGGTTWVGVGA